MILSKRRTDCQRPGAGGASHSAAARCMTCCRTGSTSARSSHKGRHYPGQHAPILGQELWEQAQSVLKANAGERQAGHRLKDPSLLAGLLFDAAGRPHDPDPCGQGRQALSLLHLAPTGDRSAERCTGGVPDPAPEVERSVCDRLRAWFADAAAVLEATASTATDVEQQRTVIGQAGALARSWPELNRNQQREIIYRIVRRIDLGEESISLEVLPDRLEAVLRGTESGTTDTSADHARASSPLVLSISTRLQRIEKSGRMLVEAGPGGQLS